MDLQTQFSTLIATSPEDMNYGMHVGEGTFHTYFMRYKDAWIAKFLSANQVEGVHFITRTYSVEIRKEVFHPSELCVECASITFEEFRLELALTMKIGGFVCAKAKFLLIPVNVLERKIITKTTLYEKHTNKTDHTLI